MSRKHCRRRHVVPMLPRGLRPKLAADQVRDLAICHLENLDAIHAGQADTTVMWHWIESVYTWLRVAQLLGEGETEMVAQLELATRLVERFGATNVVQWGRDDYQRAKVGLLVMETLSLRIDRQRALEAVFWSETEMAKLHAAVAAAQHQRASSCPSRSAAHARAAGEPA